MKAKVKDRYLLTTYKDRLPKHQNEHCQGNISFHDYIRKIINLSIRGELQEDP